MVTRSRLSGAGRVGLCLALASALGAAAAQVPGAPARTPQPLQEQAGARHGGPALSQEARDVLAWIRASANNAGLPFALVDKRAAAVHVFDGGGFWQGSAPALLGLARGDHSVPGIGERPIAQIAPHERTTPAGRFVSEPGSNLKGEDIVWVDYDDAISLHRVRSAKASERRLQRLASATPSDNRISYGCINVPAPFYDRFVAPTLGRRTGVVYVLPETQPAAAFFGFTPQAAAR